MDWKEQYKSRLTTAEQAVKKIKSGDRVVIAHATGEPVHITDAMVANAENYENVEIIHMVSMGKSAYCAPGMEKHFRHNSFFIGGTTRAACAEGRADITPVYFLSLIHISMQSLPSRCVRNSILPLYGITVWTTCRLR